MATKPSKKKQKALRQRQTKIVATIGPASNTEEMIRKLFDAGVDVFRLNFSHGTHDDHRNVLEIIRKIEKDYDAPIGVLADLQGPKLRVGKFKNGSINLKEGMIIRFDLNKEPGNTKRVNLPHPEIIEALNEGDLLLLDDGKVRMEVVTKKKTYMEAKVLSGSKLSDRKGVNVPGVTLPIPALTDKDRRDLAVALDMGVDWVAQSFVQRPSDVAEARKLIGGRAKLMAKIEKPSALKHFDTILDHVDGIMLARGDLGVEIPPEDVPAEQKRIVRKTRHAGKPIIVATQMLESMIKNPTPTRAEASDVATAVYDGTDAVMLSAETAAGNYPVEAVAIMDRICRHTENDETYRRIIEADQLEIQGQASDAITAAAYDVAHSIEAACIVNYTTSGSTSLRTARQRPTMPILCLSHSLTVARQLTLSYGVHPLFAPNIHSFAETVQHSTRMTKEIGLAKKGQRLVLTAGVPFGTPGSTNVLRVAWVE